MSRVETGEGSDAASGDTASVGPASVETAAGDAPPGDADEAPTNLVDPMVPRPIDRPTALPFDDTLDKAVGDIAKTFAAPDDPADWSEWRDALVRWRDDARRRLDYDGSAYEDSASRWTQSAYSVALVWLWDERLFDHGSHRFTVDEFLGATSRYGGFDGIVLWHAYPIIGIDDRNQFDFYRDVPGIRELIGEFQRRGIRVFIDYNPWDIGTRRTGHDDAEELALLVEELGTDGVFLDTMKEGDAGLISALRAASPPQALEGESRVPNQRIVDHQLSWAQWFADSDAPGVMRAHWYERRHMMHSTRRWNRDHSNELQSAWMNGTGMLVWDAVFGVWVGWNPRDTSTLRRMTRVQRACSHLLVGGEWTPLVDVASEALAAGVYASRFDDDAASLWTVVNRGSEPYTGPVVMLPAAIQAWDATTGSAVQDAIVTVPAKSCTAIVAADGEPTWLADLLAESRLDDFDPDAIFPARTAERVAPPSSRQSGTTDAAVLIPSGEYELEIRYRRRETGFYQGAPYVEEWKPLPPRLHDSVEIRVTADVGRVAVATREVTNAEFARFMSETAYIPKSSNRFRSNDAAHRGEDPVTCRSLDDARAYADWAGARLPTEFEWQLSASDPRFQRLAPEVWNWTESEHTDGITRFVMLKGGSEHESTGSDWYVDGGPREPEFSLKYLLAGLGVDRSPSIGFRIAWDLS